MKTKDNLLKGIIIGIFVIVVPLILMSTTNYTTVNDEVGTFELEMSPQEDGTLVLKQLLTQELVKLYQERLKEVLLKIVITKNKRL